MTEEQKQKIRDGYQCGDSLAQIASAAGVSGAAADIYLTEWASAGAPGAFEDGSG